MDSAGSERMTFTVIEPQMTCEQGSWYLVPWGTFNGEVFYRWWFAGVDEQPFLANLGRMPLEHFEMAVKDAEVERDALRDTGTG